MIPMEKQIEKMMSILGITEEEAIQLLEDDKAIDKGAKMFDLPPELEEGSKKARRADRKPNSTPTKRERKEDIDKRALITLLVSALSESADSVEVSNPERQIDFTFSNRKFRIVLSAPRS